MWGCVELQIIYNQSTCNPCILTEIMVQYIIFHIHSNKMGTTPTTNPKTSTQQPLTKQPLTTNTHRELQKLPQKNHQNLDNIIAQSSDDDNSMVDELMNTQQCCGIITCKSKNKKQLSWVDHVLEFCQRNQGRVIWVEDVKLAIQAKGTSRNRKIYIKAYNDIKYMQKQPSKSEREQSLSATQIKKFKNNLKKSVLLHYNQVVNPIPNRYSSRIQSTIKLQPCNSLMLNKSFQQNNAYAQNIRSSIALRQTLIKQNKQNPMMSFYQIGKSFNRANLRESVINLVDDTMSSLFKGEEQEISKINAYQLEIFVKFTVMLENHLTDSQNKICQIIHIFYNSIYKRYGRHYPKNAISQLPIQQKNNQKISSSQSVPSSSISIPHEPSPDLTNLQIEQLLENTKLFINLLTKIVQDYYNIKTFGNIEEGSNYLINNYENILTVIGAIVFKDDRFYNFIFSAIKIFNKEKDERANFLFQKIHGKSPQYFSIRPEYCLNDSTFKKFIDEMSSVQSNIQNLVPEDLGSSTDQPYSQCSQCLVRVIKSKTPISKMKAILQCAQKITESIIEFYKNNQMGLKNKMIDADQVLSIFCYILSIKQITDIFSQVFMIEYFATQHQKISMTGYYFSVLSCAVEENFSQAKMEIYQQELEQIRRRKTMGRIEEDVEEEGKMTSKFGSQKKPFKRETNSIA